MELDKRNATLLVWQKNNCHYIYSKLGMTKLLEKAENKAKEELWYTGQQYGRWMRCRWLYRDSSKDYFDRFQHDGIMRTKEKEKGWPQYGDKFSPINLKDEERRPKGLFFSANVDYKGKPVNNSPYGDTRFLIDPNRIITDTTNMYFADFYCCYRGEKDIHSVVIILAESGGQLDIICQRYLIQLDKEVNPFLYRSGAIWVVNVNVWVEVMVTRDIDLEDGEFDRDFNGYKQCPRNGNGSKVGCKICDIQPFDPDSDLWVKAPDLNFNV